MKVCNKYSNIPGRKRRRKKTKTKTLNPPNIMPFFAGPLPVQCGGGRRPGSLGDVTQDCSMSEDFLSPRTLLTGNFFVKVYYKYSKIARQKQKTKKTLNSPNMPFFTGAHPDIARQKESKTNENVQLTKHDAFLYWSSSSPMWCWATARKLGGCYSGLFHFGGLLA